MEGMVDARFQNMPLVFDLGMTVDMLECGKEFRFLDLGPDSSVSSPSFPDGTLSETLLDQHTGETVSTEQGSDDEWKYIPLHTPPTCELDRLIHGVLAAASPLTEPGHELNEATFPSTSSLLNPSVEADKSRPLSTLVAAQVWKSSVQGLTARIAFMYVLSQLLRWYLRRDKQSYAHMPDFMKPSLLQRTVAHPAWIDLLIWPDVRDLVIQRMDWNDFPSFRQVAGGSLSVGWPYTDSGAILESADGHHLALNPIFKAHIRNVKNWTFGLEVRKEFPWTGSCCRAGPR
ncbi:hypothetical protein GE09DRAFT_1192270 [Coniochaeta sp. 2T2.1]|nr:hypothetical protein GE09DRAFT_1192270 [Coniochaeta sp. 2T2.1]